ncbi:MAG: carboxypeptidase-like regulatory domain-containing protein, partial [Salibacteraceae bacterium]
MTSTGNFFRWLVLQLVVFPLTAAAQTGTLKGTIVDNETKETLIGATVPIVGTYLGTVTDIDGIYVIKEIKPGDYSVKVTYVGYADKVYNGIRIEKGGTKTLNISLETRATSIQEVVIVGEKNLINLESGQSEIKISTEDIKEMNVRDVKDIVSMQNGVTQNADGIQIRGGRVYETQYLVDGISAQDPLAGTGFGVEVSSSSIKDLKLITGGAGAEYGDGSSGVISTSIREGGKKFEIAGSWQRDNFGSNVNSGASWNTDIVELSMGTPIPFTKKKVTFFTSVNVNLTDDYYRAQAGQLHSSLFSNNDSIWAPRQNNKFSHTVKLAYQLKPGTKLTLTNQHSLAVNQNTRSLQIIGFDAVVRPGLQNRFINDLDNANTYTHHSNLSILNFNHFFNNNWNFNLSAGRLFTNLRSDANGRPFREETVDQILDPRSVVTDPVTLFNP